MKYILTDIKKTIYREGKFIYLHQIKATETTENASDGELGGFIESEKNLSKNGSAWVCADAIVYGNAKVEGESVVYMNCEIFGETEIINSTIGDGSLISGGNIKDSKIYDSLIESGVINNSSVIDSLVSGSCFINNSGIQHSKIEKNAVISDFYTMNARIGLNGIVSRDKRYVSISRSYETVTFYRIDDDETILTLSSKANLPKTLDEEYGDGEIAKFVKGILLNKEFF